MKNQFGAEYDFTVPFDMYGINIPAYKELAPVPIPKGIQISICVPLYNRADIIELSLQSILMQSFPKEAYEIIFVDDASTDNTRQVMEKLCEKYSEYNIKAFFLDRTRTFNDALPLNIAFRQSVGWIVMLNQIDLIHVGEVLESTWRHHNYRDKLWFCPKAAGMKRVDADFITDQIQRGVSTEIEKICASYPSQFFPHEWAASVRKEYVMGVHGRGEDIIGEGPNVDFQARLTRLSIVFGEDTSIAAVHRYGIARSREYPKKAPFFIHPDNYIRNKGNNWGILTDQEQISAITTRGNI